MSAELLAERTGDPVEDYALALLIRHPNLMDEARERDSEMFSLTENRQLFANLTTCSTIKELKDGLDPALATLFTRLEGLAGSMVSASGQRTAQTALRECLARLELKRLRERQESMLQTPADELPEWDTEGASVQEVNRRILEIESMMAS